MLQYFIAEQTFLNTVFQINHNTSYIMPKYTAGIYISNFGVW